jgi:hypothetical protein
MKTNSFVRGILRIRTIVFCLTIVGLVVAEVRFGHSLAARIGQTTVRQTDSPAAPNASISDLMAAAR